MGKRLSNYFVTFGDGHSNVDHFYKAAASRLVSQAQSAGWFSGVNHYDVHGLGRLDSVWLSRHANFISMHRRGFGYWIWKPFIIFHELRKLKLGELLTYADCGYELWHGGRDRFVHFEDLSRQKDIYAAEISEPAVKWTKNDLFLYFGIETYPHNTMIQSGFFVIRKSSFTLDLFRNFSNIIVSEDYHLVDDSPSQSRNDTSFVEHRHDQSICDLLFRTYGLTPGTSDDYHPTLWESGFFKTDVPFHAMRNISGNPRIQM